MLTPYVPGPVQYREADILTMLNELRLQQQAILGTMGGNDTVVLLDIYGLVFT